MRDNVHFSPTCNPSGFLSMKAIPDLLVSRDIKNLYKAVFQGQLFVDAGTFIRSTCQNVAIFYFIL